MALVSKVLFELLRGYSALVPVNALSFPLNLPITLVHNFLLNSILLEPHFERYPPSKEYQYMFWKWTINNLEQMSSVEDMDIDERLYIQVISLLPPSSSGLGIATPPSESYVTHFWTTKPLDAEMVDMSDYQKATLLESRTTVESGTTGLRTWLASLVLAQYLILNPDLVSNNSVLELGSGTGFLGVVVASLQIRSHQPSDPSLCLTDANEMVLKRCSDNVRLPCNLSSSHPNITCRILNWSDSLDASLCPSFHDLLANEIHPNILLGADLVFDSSLIPPLIGVLHLALRLDVTREAFIALTLRNEDTLREFLLQAEQLLMVEDLRMHFDEKMFLGVLEYGVQSVRIFRITYKW